MNIREAISITAPEQAQLIPLELITSDPQIRRSFNEQVLRAERSEGPQEPLVGPGGR